MTTPFRIALANLPFPRRDMLPSSQYTTMYTIEATRGCIHQCEFCVVPAAWGRPLQRPVAETVRVAVGVGRGYRVVRRAGGPEEVRVSRGFGHTAGAYRRERRASATSPVRKLPDTGQACPV